MAVFLEDRKFPDAAAAVPRSSPPRGCVARGRSTKPNRGRPTCASDSRCRRCRSVHCIVHMVHPLLSGMLLKCCIMCLLIYTNPTTERSIKKKKRVEALKTRKSRSPTREMMYIIISRRGCVCLVCEFSFPIYCVCDSCLLRALIHTC